MMQGSLAERLRILRARQGLTLTEASERIGITRHTLSSLERGGQEPHYPTLRKIANGYGVAVEDLLEEPEGARPATKAEAPQLTVEQFAEHGIEPTSLEIATLNAKLKAFVELAQTGAPMTTITIPHVEGAEATRVDMSRVDMLISFAAMAGILTEEDKAVILNGVARELAAS